MLSTYTVYDREGYEVGYIRSDSHREAERQAILTHGGGTTIRSTELPSYHIFTTEKELKS